MTGSGSDAALLGRRVMLLGAVVAMLGACGRKGKLELPERNDKSGESGTRRRSPPPPAFTGSGTGTGAGSVWAEAGP